MAREYFCAYHSFLEAMEPLNDAERGRLFTACLIYSKTGESPELRGNERFVFPGCKAQIDRDKEKYGSFITKQAENGKKGGRPPKPTETQKTQAFFEKPKKTKGKEKEKGKEMENITPPIPPSLGGRSPVLETAFSNWLTYKAEKKQGYTPTGLQSLITQVRKHVDQYGDQAVADLIITSMASNWQGIIFDRLQKEPKRNGGNVFMEMLEECYGT